VIDERAAEVTERLAKPAEGLRLKPYLCPAGVPTIGYGATTYLDGRPVKLTDPPISPEAAERLLHRQVATVYQPGTRALCPRLSGDALGAITDFSFNLGLTRLKASTLRRKLNAGDLEGAKAELLKWVRGGGRVLPGLVLRRKAEAALL
jgi:lysozyme